LALAHRPAARDVDLDRVERRRAKRAISLVDPIDDPGSTLEAVALDRLRERIDHPEMCDALSRVDLYLSAAVHPRGRRRDDLTDPRACGDAGRGDVNSSPSRISATKRSGTADKSA